jgi:cysteine desulfurase
MLDIARDGIAEALHCSPGEIIFTSGGTESDNLAVMGAARAAGGRKHVLVSSVEHHAVLHAADALAAEGFEIETVPVDAAGLVSPEVVASLVRPDTAIVSVMAASNEIGTIQPVREIASICHMHGTVFHTDAVQALGHIAVSVVDWGVDLLSLSAHKFGGPMGAGVLYVRDGIEVRPTLFGGAQERGRRGGTENVPALAGMDSAVRTLGLGKDQGGAEVSAGQALWAAEARRIRRLRDRLRFQLAGIPGAWFNTPAEGVIPGILNVGFEGALAETLLLSLDLEGVAASSGSACASGSMEPSHVLRSMGLEPTRAKACVRFSLGWTTTSEEIDQATMVIERVVERARSANH